MKYKVELEEISLEEAVGLIDQNLTVFYTYGIGKPIWLLDEESLLLSIKNKAIYLTPDSFVEAVKSI